jgi:microcystin degradation protein MlrC
MPGTKRQASERKLVAIFSFALESNCFNAAPRRISSFQHLSGQEYESNERQAGFVRVLRGKRPELFADVDVHFVVLYRGWCGGLIPSDDFETMKEAARSGLHRIIANDDLRRGKLDGAFFDLHGAASVAERGTDGDAEAEFVEAVKTAGLPVGLCSASFDLHANVSLRLCAALDIVVAYKTMPHVDMEETKTKALRLLLESLQNSQRVIIVALKIPLLLAGGCVLTTKGPGKDVYDELLRTQSEEAANGLLDASLFVGHQHANEARAGAAVVLTGLASAEASMGRTAQAIAQHYWNLRERCLSSVAPSEWAACLTEMYDHFDAGGWTLLGDAGDNGNAGASGDVPFLLRCFLSATANPRRAGRAEKRGHPSVLICGLVDAPAVEACAGSRGSSSGSEGDREEAMALPALSVGATEALPALAKYGDGTESLTLPNARCLALVNGGAWAVVEASPTVVVVLQRSAWAFFDEADIARLTERFHPRHFDIVVFKGGDAMRRLEPPPGRQVKRLYVNSPGATQIPVPDRCHLPKGTYPVDKARQWEAPLGSRVGL